MPAEVLALIPKVIDTCITCRKWSAAKPDVTPTLSLPLRQDENIEADILFYRKYMVWHMIDRADRWHHASQIASKTPPDLITAITGWIQIYGPFKYLIIDGESGIHAEETVRYLKRLGTLIRERAPGQHARMIERRGAILRLALHLIEDQLARDGITAEFRR